MNLRKLLITLLIVNTMMATLVFNVAFADEKTSGEFSVVLIDEAEKNEIISDNTKEETSGETLQVVVEDISGEKIEDETKLAIVGTDESEQDENVASGDEKVVEEKEAVSGEEAKKVEEKETISGEEAQVAKASVEASGEALLTVDDKAKASGEANVVAEAKTKASGEELIVLDNSLVSGEELIIVSGDKAEISGDDDVKAPVDVNKDTWYAEYVEKAIDKKYMYLNEKNEFLPKEYITKGEAIGSLEIFMPKASGDKESDIFSGEEELEKQVTRQDVANLMYGVINERKMGFEEDWLVLLDYEDVLDIEGKNYEGVAWAHENKVMIGRPDNTFGAKEFMTRAELATVLVRLGEIIK